MKESRFETAKREFYEIAISSGFKIVGEYVNNRVHILLQCQNNHDWSVTPNSFKSKKRTGCPKCNGRCPVQAEKEFLSIAKDRGYTVIGKYVNNRVRVPVKCPEGHDWLCAPGSFKAGVGCQTCALEYIEDTKENFYRSVSEKGFTVVGEYVGMSTQILMKCPDGHDWLVFPNNFNRGARCPSCSGRTPEKMKERFLNKVTERGYTILGEYVDNETKVYAKCPEGHKLSVLPKEFNRGAGCAKCSGVCTEQAKERFYKIASERGYTILGEYKGTLKKTKMKCPEGHDTMILPSNFGRGSGCSKCTGRCPEQAKEDFYKEASSRGYTPMGEYVNVTSKVKMKCPEGHDFDIAPYSFRRGVGCSKCAGFCPQQAKEQIFKEVSSRGFSIVGKYINTTDKVKMKCPEGHDFDMAPYAFRRGQGCPFCAKHGFKTDKPAYFYLTTWTNEGYNVLKFGITNNTPMKRFKEQSSNNTYTYKSHVHLYFASGDDAIKLEKTVKQYQKVYGPILTRSEFPDGYTETIDYSHYANVMDIINDYVDGLVEHGIEVEWG